MFVVYFKPRSDSWTGTTPRCATGSVLELLDAKDLELRLLSMATLANVLAFSDTLLLSREECIDAVHDRMDVVVGSIKRCDDGDGDGVLFCFLLGSGKCANIQMFKCSTFFGGEMNAKRSSAHLGLLISSRRTSRCSESDKAKLQKTRRGFHRIAFRALTSSFDDRARKLQHQRSANNGNMCVLQRTRRICGLPLPILQ